LPEVEDPSQGPRWDAEVLLDKLARMKGRLLKGGEPDIEGVAKILLSDWVRGRIPYFVEPPPKPVSKATEDPKGKGKAAGLEENKSGLGVPQKLKGIIQKNTFVDEDVKGQEGDEDKEEEEWKGFGDAVSDAGSDGGEEDEEEDLQWADVFPEDSLANDHEKVPQGMYQSSSISDSVC